MIVDNLVSPTRRHLLRLGVLGLASLLFPRMLAIGAENGPQRMGERPPEQLSPGGRVLMRAHAAYRALRSYRGTIDLSGTASYANKVHRETRRYRIYYKQKARLRLEGKDSNGDPEWLIISGKKAVDDHPSAYGQMPPTAECVLYAHSGTTLGASFYLPSFLLDVKWADENGLVSGVIRKGVKLTKAERDYFPNGAFLTYFARLATLKGKSVVNKRECYMVECIRDKNTIMFYVDAKSHLIRRVVYSQSSKQTAVQRRDGGGGFSGKILATEIIQTFHINSVNGKIEDSLFAMPRR